MGLLTKKKKGFMAAGAAALMLFLSTSHAGDLNLNELHLPLEHKVKAAYIFNFIRFVEWEAGSPLPADGPLVIGVVGRDAFTPSLKKALDGQSVEGHAIKVKQVSVDAFPPDLRLLYIARSQEDKLPAILQSVGSRPVMTVSDARGFVEQGGMLKLALEDNKIQFTVNMPAVRRAGLKISSQMLQYANVVK